MFAGLEVFQSAIRGVIQTMNNMSLESAINLSYAAVYVLHRGTPDIKDKNVFRLWRSIFEDLGQLLQDVIARQGKTDLSKESVYMLDYQINLMDYMDTGKPFFERDSDDDTAYVHWSQTFEPEHSVFDDRFVSATAKLFPRRRNWYWRIRRLEDMKKQEVQAENGKRAGEGTATADENDPGESSRAKEPIDDEVRLTSSEPGRSGSVVHLQSDGGGPSGDLAVASEVKDGKDAGGGTTGVAEAGDDNGPEGTSRFMQGERTLTSGEPGQSANVPSRSNEVGERDGDVVVVVGEVKNGDSEKAAAGSTTVDEDHRDDGKGAKQPIADEIGLTLREPGQSAVPSHSDEDEQDGDSASASEIKNDSASKKAAGGTTTVDVDDEDNGKGTSKCAADESMLTSSEQEQPAHGSPAHSDEGGPDRPAVVVRHESDNEDASSPEGKSSAQVEQGD